MYRRPLTLLAGRKAASIYPNRPGRSTSHPARFSRKTLPPGKRVSGQEWVIQEYVTRSLAVADEASLDERRWAQPYGPLIACLLFTGALIFADVDAGFPDQIALGAATFAMLWLCSHRLPATDQRQIWVCVAISTAVELFATQVWGVYRYRLLAVPLFVPPGHGLICYFGLAGARTPLMVKHGKAVCRAVVAFATAWAIAGLTVLPRITGRLDVEGALFLPSFLWLMWMTPRARDYAGTFLMASYVELLGTFGENWSWNPILPVLGFPCANPPSAAAGGYCWFGALALMAVAAFDSRRARAAATALNRLGSS